MIIFKNRTFKLIIDEEYVYDHSGRKKETYEMIMRSNRILIGAFDPVLV
ncbi:hypothetical protein ACFOG5_24110 [Pedobacter fastidiosus]|uniref:Uncharacterized protein n=1 Tax=Pedobacter fastidiosus TaxID=2765361 RepID=A0ABR7KX89_9SPHI|nr:hypothetical protein [Pedobacter fastidiosus]MBC6112636.1 hypothetical protein [Pedobacter fastidiosus]